MWRLLPQAKFDQFLIEASGLAYRGIQYSYDPNEYGPPSANLLSGAPSPLSPCATPSPLRAPLCVPVLFTRLLSITI